MSGGWRAYLAILKMRLIGETQYRTGFWAVLSTTIFWGFVLSSILCAYYQHGARTEAALTLQQAVSRIWIMQICLNLLPGYGMDFSVWNKVRSGDVGYELLRPLDLYGHWYARAISNRLGSFLLAVGPVALVAALIPAPYGLAAPASAVHLLACLVSLAFGLAVSCTGICLTYAMLMDAHVGDAPARMAMIAMQILSGSYLPLELWPDWMQKFLYWQPFSAMADLPLRFYVGTMEVSALPNVLIQQLLWGLVLALIGRTWINRNVKKLVIQGG